MQVKKNTIWQLSFHNLNEYKQQLNRYKSCLKTSTLRNNIWDGHTDIVIYRGRFAPIFLLLIMDILPIFNIGPKHLLDINEPNKIKLENFQIFGQFFSDAIIEV